MKKIFSFSKVRVIFFLLILFTILFSSKLNIAVGTLCSYCPVGILSVAAAAKYLSITMGMVLIAVIVFTIFFGRAFCSWGCPTAFIRKVFGIKHSVSQVKSDRAERSKFADYSSYTFLGITIIGSFFVGFPLFCLLCPIGLFFGFIFAGYRLFTSLTPGWELLIFPAIIVLEILVFRKWCSSICPVGAFFKLVNILSVKVLRLKNNKDRCIEANGGACNICKSICSEKISIPYQDKDVIKDCTLCLSCKDHCPTKAIEIKRK